MWYQGSSTRTGDALMALKNQVFTVAAGMRTDKSIPKVCMICFDFLNFLNLNLVNALLP